MLERLFSAGNRAEFYHRQLTEDARRYLVSRGLTDTAIDRHRLGWNGSAVTIPVRDRGGEVVAILLQPLGEGAPVFTDGTPELYGWDTLAREPARIIVTENPVHRLILEVNGFAAVCSTSPAVFLPEWADAFPRTAGTYIATSRTARGRVAAEAISRVMPDARVVAMPEDAIDIEAIFADRRNGTREFERLLRDAHRQAFSVGGRRRHARSPRVLNLLAYVPIGRVIGDYAQLARVNGHMTGRCPLHDDHQRSLYVYPELNTFRCLSCGKEGDAIDFLMMREELTFWQAVERLERIRYGDA